MPTSKSKHHAASPAGARDCAARVRSAVSHLQRCLRSAAPPDDIALAKLSLLGLLWRHEALTPTEAARHEGVRLQSLTRLLAELETSGWIARRADPDDARRSLLSLTRGGRARLSAHARTREAVLSEAIAAELSPMECARLAAACALLERVAGALAKVAGGTGGSALAAPEAA